MAGVNLLHVPYRGGAPAIQDMIAGNCDMMFGKHAGVSRPDRRRRADPHRLRFAARPRRSSPTCR